MQDLVIDLDVEHLGEAVLERVSERLLRSSMAPQVVDVPLAQVLDLVRAESLTKKPDVALPPDLPVVVAARFMQRRNAESALVIADGQESLVDRDKLLMLAQEMGRTFSTRAAHEVRRIWQAKGLEISTFFLNVYDRAGDAECRRQVCYQCTIDPAHTFPGGKGRSDCSWGDYPGHVHAQVVALPDTDTCCG